MSDEYDLHHSDDNYLKRAASCGNAVRSLCLETMWRCVKYGLLAMSLVSACYGIYQVKQIMEVKQEIDAGMDPKEALSRLAEKDKTGVVSKVIEAHLEGMDNIGGMKELEAAVAGAAKGDPDAADRLSKAAMALSQGAASGSGTALVQTVGGGGGAKTAPIKRKRVKAEPLASSTIKTLAAGEEVEEGPGVAVLIDEKTGERIVLKSSRKPSSRRRKKRKASSSSSFFSLPGLPPEVAEALGLNKISDKTIQRWKAYALMGATLFGTILLILWARRKFG